MKNRTTCGLIRLMVLVLVYTVKSQTFATDIYVSLDGRAQADGSLANPYGTIPEALTAVRSLRKGGLAEPVTIFLRGGRHQINENLVLGLEDGRPATSEVVTPPRYGAGESTEPAILTFAAYPGEQGLLSANHSGWLGIYPRVRTVVPGV